MRISREQMFMEIAKTVSKRSTCHRLNVGAVLVVDNRVVSIGYNGPPSGELHCQGNKCQLSESGGCGRSLHAEYNALKYYLENHKVLPSKGMDLYITHSPCSECALFIKDAGVQRIYYETAYRNTTPLEFLVHNSVKVYRLTPSGYLINHLTNLIEELK